MIYLHFIFQITIKTKLNAMHLHKCIHIAQVGRSEEQGNNKGY